MSLNTFIQTLPPVAFNHCQPALYESEIVNLYIASTFATSFTDWTNENQWKQRISNDNVIPSGSVYQEKDLIKCLFVTGTKQEPKERTIDISGARKITKAKETTIAFSLDEIHQANYDFLNYVEGKESLPCKVWWLTKGGVLFGGNNGVNAALKLKHLLAQGGEFETINGTIVFGANVSAKRFVTSTSFGGSITVPSIPVNPPSGGDTLTVYTYRAIGNETQITNAALQNKVVLNVTRGGIGVEDIVTSNSNIGYNQVYYNSSTGSISFHQDQPLQPTEFIRVLLKNA